MKCFHSLLRCLHSSALFLLHLSFLHATIWTPECVYLYFHVIFDIFQAFSSLLPVGKKMLPCHPPKFHPEIANCKSLCTLLWWNYFCKCTAKWARLNLPLLPFCVFLLKVYLFALFPSQWKHQNRTEKQCRTAITLPWVTAIRCQLDARHGSMWPTKNLLFMFL